MLMRLEEGQLSCESQSSQCFLGYSVKFSWGEGWGGGCCHGEGQ